ncbi:uncharacterized protein SPSK_06165 [Sporothrix schenckii 1099-18]|uniref:C3H1-type domain-containing protein n=1 Tax=Sporothrix schenckii 1099-18 TaxID=1397361 RepID=A0A0F2MLQ6_SPOSC|nr:uncharacterized protein SPSK_06165 [Sporothrix schenckii 1099-18]KJR89969.1 hypothetical protein SPSK_06165 [Sporothrix schenckii 1099-18]
MPPYHPTTARPNPARLAERPDECLFFIDDSNIWIHAQKFAAKANAHRPKLTDSDQDPRLRIDIGRLVTTLLKANGGSDATGKPNRHRVQSKSFYYGSKPPPSDSVWEAMEKNHFETKIYDRAASGREKEVDGSMGADISGIASDLSARADMEAQMEAKYRIEAYEHRNRINLTTFICITGDRDMMPAILKALKSGICVELWAWKHALSKDFVKLETATDKQPLASLFSVNYLDGVFADIFFTNYFSTRRGRGTVDPAKSVVLCDFVPAWYEQFMLSPAGAGGAANDPVDGPWPGPLGKDESRKGGPSPLEKAVCDKLMLLGKVFYITRDEPTATAPATAAPPTLFIEFSRVPNNHIEPVLLKVRTSFRGIATVLSWPVYAGRTNRKTMPTAEMSNMYAPLSGDDAHVQELDADDDDVGDVGDVGDAGDAEEAEEADEGTTGVDVNAETVDGTAEAIADTSTDGTDGTPSEDGWQTVSHFDRAESHRRNRNRTQRCRYGIHCYKRGQCGSVHTNMEHNLFQEFPWLNFKRWRSEPCRFGDACASGRRCAYAHSASEAWCMNCHIMGHYSSDCKH